MGTRIGQSSPMDKAVVGVPKLLEDLARLANDKESADVVFFVGREEVPVYAHRLILMTRCKNFHDLKRNEGTTVGQESSGTVTPILLPQFQSEVYQQVIYYLYTGKIVIQDGSVFEIMSIAQELGCDELRVTCEDHVTSTLSVHNACTFLLAAVNQEISSNGKGGRAFADRCVVYIGENATECLKTPSFLSLSKDAVIRLLASDHIAMEEEEVWRAVLAWAKYQAGVSKPPMHWTEEERKKVAQYLMGVINHVRLLLIDSQVFAEEVEPTGAVPIELSLERYRFAALPNKFRENQDKRLQPRLSRKLFIGTQILSQDKVSFQRVLNQWYGKPKQAWRLIYRASTHGYSAEAFHKHCDGNAPSFVIVLGPQGQVCGGFSDVPWGKGETTKGCYSYSNRNFLFSLINNQNTHPLKFDVTKGMFAVAQHSNYGPIFGAGADLFISSECNLNDESYSNLPHSYDGDEASWSILMGNYNFTVSDYEVFTPQF